MCPHTPQIDPCAYFITTVSSPIHTIRLESPLGWVRLQVGYTAGLATVLLLRTGRINLPKAPSSGFRSLIPVSAPTPPQSFWTRQLSDPEQKVCPWPGSLNETLRLPEARGLGTRAGRASLSPHTRVAKEGGIESVYFPSLSSISSSRRHGHRLDGSSGDQDSG